MSIVDESGVLYSTEYDTKITALAVSYMNANFPYLRFLHADNLKLFVITGHESGWLEVWQVGHDGIGDIDNEKFAVIKMDRAVRQLVITE